MKILLCEQLKNADCHVVNSPIQYFRQHSRKNIFEEIDDNSPDQLDNIVENSHMPTSSSYL